MKRDDIFTWQTIMSTEDGDVNHPAATFTFDIPVGLYVEKDRCERICCTAIGCDCFCWKLKWNKTNSQHKTVSPNNELLIDFVSLANESVPQDFAKKVESFAQKWGNLDLCEEHQTPASHNYNCKPSISHKKVTLRPVDSSNALEEDLICSENLSAWHKFAVFAKSLLNIAANLQQGSYGKDKDWQNLHSIGFIGWSHVKEKKKESYRENLLEFEQKLIADAVNSLLVIGNLRPEIRWQNNQIITVFKSASSYGSLSANLALQIMLAVGKQKGLAICSTCGVPYTPNRKPASNRRRFCSQCYDSGKPQALASSDYRSRKNKK